MRRFIIIINLLLIPLSAQTLNLFTDCRRCDQDYIRREVSYVNHVRNREDADFHLLVTDQTTGGGVDFTLLLHVQQYRLQAGHHTQD